MIEFNPNKSGKNIMTRVNFDKFDNILPSDDIHTLVEQLKNRAYFEMSDIGYFRKIENSIINHKPVITIGKISLSIEPTSKSNNSQERILQATIVDKTESYKTEQVLARGSRDDILKQLNDTNFEQNFKSFLMQCSDDFEK